MAALKIWHPGPSQPIYKVVPGSGDADESYSKPAKMKPFTIGSLTTQKCNIIVKKNKLSIWV